jgi:hypothetical protein
MQMTGKYTAVKVPALDVEKSNRAATKMIREERCWTWGLRVRPAITGRSRAPGAKRRAIRLRGA